jgi:diaminopimelate decarboxylase
MRHQSELLHDLAECHGPSYYLLDIQRFRANFAELRDAFRSIYPGSHLAYSYKTNYAPRLCQEVDALGGYAEVVSSMELELALRCGVVPERIFFNGPYKPYAAVERLLTAGGMVNLDCLEEVEFVREVSRRHPTRTLQLGLRCNFEVGDGVASRFGFDVGSQDFVAAAQALRSLPNCVLAGLQCHFATRSLDTWPVRADSMLRLVRDVFSAPPRFISLGGGLYGKMPDSLRRQFSSPIPTFDQYATATAEQFARAFGRLPSEAQPLLIIEPGTAIVGDVMCFVATVVSIKSVRGRVIAHVSGSAYNINPTLNQKNLPLSVIPCQHVRTPRQHYQSVDLGGYTCIESDYLYRGYSGELCVGDLVVFGNAGSYSIVLKPPFILPNFPMLEWDSANGHTAVLKQAETFDHVFHTFAFQAR